MRRFSGALTLFVSLSVTLMVAGCGEEPAATPTNGPAQGPGGPGGGSGEPRGPGGPPSKIKVLMGSLAKGPNSLTPTVGKELKEENPPWDTIQPKAKEFARLAAELAKEPPPKGSQESWAKLTSAYAEEATALDKAAQAKDKAAALEAHGLLSTSCKECHDAHRPGPGPGMGGPPPGGGPPGGGPPGGAARPGSMPAGYPKPVDLEKKK